MYPSAQCVRFKHAQFIPLTIFPLAIFPLAFTANGFIMEGAQGGEPVKVEVV